MPKPRRGHYNLQLRGMGPAGLWCGLVVSQMRPHWHHHRLRRPAPELHLASARCREKCQSQVLLSVNQPQHVPVSMTKPRRHTDMRLRGAARSNPKPLILIYSVKTECCASRDGSWGKNATEGTRFMPNPPPAGDLGGTAKNTDGR